MPLLVRSSLRSVLKEPLVASLLLVVRPGAPSSDAVASKEFSEACFNQQFLLWWLLDHQMDGA